MQVPFGTPCTDVMLANTAATLGFSVITCFSTASWSVMNPDPPFRRSSKYAPPSCWSKIPGSPPLARLLWMLAQREELPRDVTSIPRGADAPASTLFPLRVTSTRDWSDDRKPEVT